MKLAKKEKAPAVEIPGTLRHIPLDHIVDHKEVTNRSINAEHVAALQLSISKDGLNTPLLVWDGGDPQNLNRIMQDGKKIEVPATFLLGGFHRRKALRALHKENDKAFSKLLPDGVPVKVITGTLEDALVAQLTDNLARLNPSYEDIYPFIERLLATGMKRGIIAKRVGKSPAYITDVMAIKDTLGDEAHEELKKGNIDLAEGRKAAKDVKKGKASKEEAVEKAKSNTQKKKDKGHTRAEKRHSINKLWKAYSALPSMKAPVRLEILEGIVSYAVGEVDKLPEEIDLEKEESDEDASKKKPSKKNKE